MSNAIVGVRELGIASTQRGITTQRNISNKENNKLVQDISSELKGNSYKYLAYTGLLGGMASTLWNIWDLISGKENGLKNWILPALSFGSSGFFALLNIKDQDIVSEKIFSSQNEVYESDSEIMDEDAGNNVIKLFSYNGELVGGDDRSSNCI